MCSAGRRARKVVGGVSSIPRTNSLSVEYEGRRRRFPAGAAVTVGREPDCAIQLADERVSRRHAVIRPTPDGWVLEDLASTNGTYADGVRIHRLTIRGLGEVRLGNATTGVRLMFFEDDASGQPRVPRAGAVRGTGAAASAAGIAALLLVIAVVTLSSRSVPATPPAAASATASTLPRSRVDIVALGKNGTVLIRQGSGIGSGAYLGNDLVMTAEHVVDGVGQITVYFDDRLVGLAGVLRRSTQHDIALLSVPGLSAIGARPLTWGDSSNLRDGEEIIALGYPAGLPLTTKVGVVSGLREYQGTDLIQTDASLNPGMSGGPVLDAEGHLIGITVFGSRNFPGLNFAVASSTARALGVRQ